MKAGRELDALVAEKVMGLVLTCPVDPRFDHSVGTNRDGSSTKRNFCRWPDGHEHWIPFFSTSITDAWQVVERLRQKSFNFGVQHPCVKHEGKAFVYFHSYTGDVIGKQSTALADTAPLAICLAALKAVGVEVSQ